MLLESRRNGTTMSAHHRGTAVARRIRPVPVTMLALLAALVSVPLARAQDLEPRAFANVPIDLNFLGAGYAFSQGAVATDPSAPLENAHLDVEAMILAYAHTFGL